jgi:DNA-binding FrmR family transcriptional regulator
VVEAGLPKSTKQGRFRVIASYKRDALLRLKTVRGHVDGVVEDEVHCPDLMKLVAALQAWLEKVNRVLLRNHLETCVSEAIRTGQGQEKIAELMEALPYNSGLTEFRHQAEPLPVPGAAAGAGTWSGTSQGTQRAQR